MERIGEKIYNLRAAKKISQEELAEQLNVMRQTVSRWETNSAYPTKENLEKICKIFNVNISYFFSEESSVEKSTEEICVAEETPISGKIENKKFKSFKTIKILLVTVCMTLLGLLVVALGIAAYVTILPVGGQYVDTIDVINYEGIIFIVLCTVSFAVFIASAILIITKAIKKRKKSKMQHDVNQNAT